MSGSGSATSGTGSATSGTGSATSGTGSALSGPGPTLSGTGSGTSGTGSLTSGAGSGTGSGTGSGSGGGLGSKIVIATSIEYAGSLTVAVATATPGSNPGSRVARYFPSPLYSNGPASSPSVAWSATLSPPPTRRPSAPRGVKVSALLTLPPMGSLSGTAPKVVAFLLIAVGSGLAPQRSTRHSSPTSVPATAARIVAVIGCCPACTTNCWRSSLAITDSLTSVSPSRIGDAYGSTGGTGFRFSSRRNSITVSRSAPLAYIADIDAPQCDTSGSMNGSMPASPSTTYIVSGARNATPSINTWTVEPSGTVCGGNDSSASESFVLTASGGVA